MTFTFQNVSISTRKIGLLFASTIPLHSKMYLFLHERQKKRSAHRKNLYIPKCIYFYNVVPPIGIFVVFLYIPKCIYFYLGMCVAFFVAGCFTFQNVSISTRYTIGTVPVETSFTFQNVSISTTLSIACLRYERPLHSKMYLFLHTEGMLKKIKVRPLHSKMYLFLRTLSTRRTKMERLYIPKCIYFYLLMISAILFTVYFTFQNVSISTNAGEITMHLTRAALHSKMYLFLPRLTGRGCCSRRLYIPKCIYFYSLIF